MNMIPTYKNWMPKGMIWSFAEGAVPESMEENWSEEDEMFVFRKVITDKND